MKVIDSDGVVIGDFSAILDQFNNIGTLADGISDDYDRLIAEGALKKCDPITISGYFDVPPDFTATWPTKLPRKTKKAARKLEQRRHLGPRERERIARTVIVLTPYGA